MQQGLDDRRVAAVAYYYDRRVRQAPGEGQQLHSFQRRHLVGHEHDPRGALHDSGDTPSAACLGNNLDTLSLKDVRECISETGVGLDNQHVSQHAKMIEGGHENTGE